MTAPADQPFDLVQLRSSLTAAGLSEGIGLPDLTQYEPGFPRQSKFQRWHYRVSEGGETLCHLIVGNGLSTVHDRAEEFSKACPELACRPLFFRSGEEGMDLLGLEHFEGETLDRLVEQGRCDAETWLKHVRRAQASLGRTRQESSADQLTQEVRTLIDEACAHPSLSGFDIQFLQVPVRRAILDGALAAPIHRQWSNGDFAGRNLLIDANGNQRLIDYEYAGCTHFGCGDWLRLQQFSVIPADLNPSLIYEMTSSRQPWLRVWFWIHHLAQLKRIQIQPTTTDHVAEAVGELFQAMARALSPSNNDAPDSWLMRRVVEHQQHINGELRLSRARLLKLTGEYESRTAWAMSVNSDLTKTRVDYSRLESEFNEHTARALSLEAELRRKIAEKNAALNLANATASEARLNAMAAEAESGRLLVELQNAQQHIDGLLDHAMRIQLEINTLGSRCTPPATDAI